MAVYSTYPTKETLQAHSNVGNKISGGASFEGINEESPYVTYSIQTYVDYNTWEFNSREPIYRAPLYYGPYSLFEYTYAECSWNAHINGSTSTVYQYMPSHSHSGFYPIFKKLAYSWDLNQMVGAYHMNTFEASWQDTFYTSGYDMTTSSDTFKPGGLGRLTHKIYYGKKWTYDLVTASVSDDSGYTLSAVDHSGALTTNKLYVHLFPTSSFSDDDFYFLWYNADYDGNFTTSYHTLTKDSATYLPLAFQLFNSEESDLFDMLLAQIKQSNRINFRLDIDNSENHSYYCYIGANVSSLLSVYGGYGYPRMSAIIRTLFNNSKATFFEDMLNSSATCFSTGVLMPCIYGEYLDDDGNVCNLTDLSKYSTSSQGNWMYKVSSYSSIPNYIEGMLGSSFLNEHSGWYKLKSCLYSTASLDSPTTAHTKGIVESAYWALTTASYSVSQTANYKILCDDRSIGASIPFSIMCPLSDIVSYYQPGCFCPMLGLYFPEDSEITTENFADLLSSASTVTISTPDDIAAYPMFAYVPAVTASEYPWSAGLSNFTYINRYPYLLLRGYSKPPYWLWPYCYNTEVTFTHDPMLKNSAWYEVTDIDLANGVCEVSAISIGFGVSPSATSGFELLSSGIISAALPNMDQTEMTTLFSNWNSSDSAYAHMYYRLPVEVSSRIDRFSEPYLYSDFKNDSWLLSAWYPSQNIGFVYSRSAAYRLSGVSGTLGLAYHNSIIDSVDLNPIVSFSLSAVRYSNSADAVVVGRSYDAEGSASDEVGSVAQLKACLYDCWVIYASAYPKIDFADYSVWSNFYVSISGDSIDETFNMCTREEDGELPSVIRPVYYEPFTKAGDCLYQTLMYFPIRGSTSGGDLRGYLRNTTAAVSFVQSAGLAVPLSASTEFVLGTEETCEPNVEIDFQRLDLEDEVLADGVSRVDIKIYDDNLLGASSHLFTINSHYGMTLSRAIYSGWGPSSYTTSATISPILNSQTLPIETKSESITSADGDSAVLWVEGYADGSEENIYGYSALYQYEGVLNVDEDVAVGTELLIYNIGE